MSAAKQQQPIDFDGAERRVFAPGAIIFREGDEGREAYILESGRVAIFRKVGDRAVVLGTVERFGIFGEMALLDPAPRMASAMAESVVTCIVVTKPMVDEMIAHAPAGLTLLMRSLVRTARRTSVELAEERLRLEDQ